MPPTPPPCSSSAACSRRISRATRWLVRWPRSNASRRPGERSGWSPSRARIPTRNRCSSRRSGVAYREHIESHVLWRWLGAHAPDLVLVAGPDAGLVDALTQNIVIGRWPRSRPGGSRPRRDYSTSLTGTVSSRARTEELERRPGTNAAGARLEQLARVYGHDFAQPNYIAAMAIISRLRLGERTPRSSSCSSRTSTGDRATASRVRRRARSPSHHALLRVTRV